jgi:hypothetical protein
VLQATRYPGGEEGPGSGPAKQGTALAGNAQTRRVQDQDRQNKVQDQQTIRRIKGTG